MFQRTNRSDTGLRIGSVVEYRGSVDAVSPSYDPDIAEFRAAPLHLGGWGIPVSNGVSLFWIEAVQRQPMTAEWCIFTAERLHDAFALGRIVKLKGEPFCRIITPLGQRIEVRCEERPHL